MLASCGGGKSKKATNPTTSTTQPGGVTTTAAGGSPPGSATIALPKGSDPTRFGLSATVVITDKDVPMVAYIDHDPNDDKKFDDSTVFAALLDPTTGRMTTPVTVAKGDTDGRGRQLSAAFDSSTKTIGVAWTAAPNQIDAAFSTDGGTTWQRTTVVKDETLSPSGPALAMAGGKATVAFVAEGKGVAVATSPSEGSSATWTVTNVPAPAGGQSLRQVHPGIAASSNGTATVTVVADAAAGGVEVDAWTVGSASLVKVMDSNKVQNDSPSVALAGSGSKLVAAATICRSEDDGNCLYSVVSSDGGKTWGDFVKIPNDATDGASFQTEAAASSTAAAVVWSPNSSNGSDQCGRPELSRSPDQHTWTSCLFDKGKTFGVSTDAYGAAFASDGTLYLVFQNASQGEAPALGAGVWLVKQAA